MEFEDGALANVHTTKGRMLPNDISNATAQAQPCDPTDVPDVPADPGDGTVGPGGGGGDIGVLGTYSTFLPEDQTVYEGSVTSSTALIPTTNAIALTGQEMVQLEAGFSAPAGTNLLVQTQNCTQSAEWQYEYYLKDHLGNVRVRFADLDLNGSISPSEVLGEHHYYPFGMEMEGDWQPAGDDNRYRYNGMEFDEDLGLYDYGARWYDPAVARWGQVDPLAGKFAAWSSYNYVYDNPLIYTDPTGMQGDLVNGVTIYFKKDGLSQEQFANAAWNYILNVMTVWGDKGANAELNLTFKILGDDDDDPELGDDGNLVTLSAGSGVSHVYGDKRQYSTIYTNSATANTAAHEFGHHLGLADRYFEGVAINFGGPKKGKRFKRRTTPIGKDQIADQDYDPLDNLYSADNGSILLTPYQLQIANSPAVEPDYQNSRGLVYGADPKKVVPYTVHNRRVKMGDRSRYKKKWVTGNKLHEFILQYNLY